MRPTLARGPRERLLGPVKRNAYGGKGIGAIVERAGGAAARSDARAGAGGGIDVSCSAQAVAAVLRTGGGPGRAEAFHVVESQRRPVSLRAMTRRWISLVPS